MKPGDMRAHESERVLRLLEKVQPDDRGCWNWPTWRNHDGYGRMRINGRTRFAHRCAYELFMGEIGPGLCIDHLCGNRACCNPWHLQPVTRAENNLRRGPVYSASCIRGHPYTANNTIVRRNGSRNCRTCHALHMKKYNARKKMESRA